MGDFFQQFKKQEQINEGLFSKLFSKGGKADEKADVYRDNNGIYHFGENSIAKHASSSDGGDSSILNFDFKNSDALGFIVEKETKFTADNIIID